MSWHTTKVVHTPNDWDASVDGHYQPACVTCEWTGQAWETEHGAEHEADFHREHPGLSGEHPVITEESER